MVFEFGSEKLSKIKLLFMVRGRGFELVLINPMGVFFCKGFN